MGYSTVIWTLGWDTNDWRMLQHQVKETDIVSTFKNSLDNLALVKSSLGGQGGPITLEHDLTTETINLSKRLIPIAQARGLQPMSLAQCLHNETPYQRGSTLGPDGEPKESEHGMPEMEDEDFGPEENSFSMSIGSTSTTTTESTTGPREKSGPSEGRVAKSGMVRMVASFGWMGAVGVAVSYFVL